MFWSSRNLEAARIAAILIVAFGVGASASAGTLYSWKTEDGTFAYTNEKKRIPARYQERAKASKLKAIDSYDRLTPGPKVDAKPYAERVVERLEILRNAAADAGLSSGGEAVVSRGAGVEVDVSNGSRNRGSGVGVRVPVQAGIDREVEPVTVEIVRTKGGKGHRATRHFQVVRRGDRVVAVIKDENHDNPLPSLGDGDFGTDSVD